MAVTKIWKVVKRMDHVIGYAKDVTPDSNNLTQSGYLVPAVDFNNLQEVLIITEMKKQ